MSFDGLYHGSQAAPANVVPQELPVLSVPTVLTVRTVTQESLAHAVPTCNSRTTTSRSSPPSAHVRAPRAHLDHRDSVETSDSQEAQAPAVTRDSKERLEIRVMPVLTEHQETQELRDKLDQPVLSSQEAQDQPDDQELLDLKVRFLWFIPLSHSRWTRRGWCPRPTW